MIGNWLLEFFNWIEDIISFLSNIMLIPGVSLLHFILACSVVTMMVTTFVSRGHE